MLRRLLMVVLLVLSTSLMAEFDHQYEKWNEFLKKHVQVSSDGAKSAVNYKAVSRSKIAKITKALLKVQEDEVNTWSEDQRLAYYINLYNSLTIQYIMTKYPKYKSIKKYRSFFRSPWKEEFFTLFGKKTDLDTIEHKKIRGDKKYNEPRIHFAVNCASVGCPALKNEAYIASRLRDQLQDSMVKFLRDRDRNYFDIKKKQLWMSKIITDWYKKDFSQGYLGYSSVKDFAQKNAQHLARNQEEKKAIESGQYEIRGAEYNWNLNDVH